MCRKVAGGFPFESVDPASGKDACTGASSLESILYVWNNANAMEISLAWVPMNYF